MGFPWLRRARATLRFSAWASHCGGFSCCGAWALGAGASVVVARGLSSCGSRASLLRGMWDLPGPGLEPVSPALAGGFLTTAPPGKSQEHFLIAALPAACHWHLARWGNACDSPHDDESLSHLKCKW